MSASSNKYGSTFTAWAIVITSLVIGAAVLLFIQYSSANSDPGIVPSDPTVVRPDTPLVPPSDKDANGCYTPATVRSHYGETACVDYNVGYTYTTSAGTKFIDQFANYTSGFVGYVPWNSGARNINLDALDGKNIKIDGYIQEYSGYPEIIVNDISQVKVYQN